MAENDVSMMSSGSQEEAPTSASDGFCEMSVKQCSSPGKTSSTGCATDGKGSSMGDKEEGGGSFSSAPAASASSSCSSSQKTSSCVGAPAEASHKQEGTKGRIAETQETTDGSASVVAATHNNTVGTATTRKTRKGRGGGGKKHASRRTCQDRQGGETKEEEEKETEEDEDEDEEEECCTSSSSSSSSSNGSGTRIMRERRKNKEKEEEEGEREGEGEKENKEAENEEEEREGKDEDMMSAHTAGSHFSDDEDDDIKMDGGVTKETEEKDNSEDIDEEDNEEERFSDKSPEERVQMALSCKDRGNEAFRTGSIADAKKAYNSGLRYVKDVKLPEAKTLRVALNSNVAMCCLKLEEWQQAIAAAGAVLQEEPSNVKALYRRGIARASFGLYSDAKADLLQVLRVEPRNADARKELEKLKEKIARDNTERRKAYSGLFDRAAGMYADREAQMQQKRKEAAEKEKKLRDEWETEMDEKKEKGEDTVPFEEWKEEKEKTREKEKKRESLAAQHTDSPGASIGRTRKSGEPRKADSLELDEEDKKIIDETKKMGYCYFRRDLTEEERKLNAQHLPTKIDTSTYSAAPAAGDAAAGTGGAGGGSSTPPPLTATHNAALNNAQTNGSTDNTSDDVARNKQQQSGVSSWNAKGTTYEEKDMSQWARRRFQARMLETSASYGGGGTDMFKETTSILSALQSGASGKGDSKNDAMGILRSFLSKMETTEVKCTEVKDLTGDAQVVVMRGSKRYLFEFSCTLLLEITVRLPPVPEGLHESGYKPEASEAPTTYKGEMTLPEVSSAEGKGEAWLSGSKVRTKKIAPQHQEGVDRAIEAFKKRVVEQIHHFLADFSKAA